VNPCAPPTHAIRAVAEGPEPVFLRRRAVIVRHQGSPHGSGTGAGYRFLSAGLPRSLLRCSAVLIDRSTACRRSGPPIAAAQAEHRRTSANSYCSYCTNGTFVMYFWYNSAAS
jgi:hypothetical protein